MSFEKIRKYACFHMIHDYILYDIIWFETYLINAVFPDKEMHSNESALEYVARKVFVQQR